MDLDRIRRLEESVLALQLDNSPKQIHNEVGSDIIARLSNLEASVIQEKAMKGELKRKLKFANNQNSRLILRLKKEKARSALFNYRMRGTKLPVTPEDNVVINYLLPEDSRMSKSMNDIPMATFGNQGRHVADSSDSQSFTDEDSLPTVRSQMSAYRMRNRSEDKRESSLGFTEGVALGDNPVQRQGVRMNGDQALQLLPSYQRTIIQQQQELRELCLKVKAMEYKYTNIIQATKDGKQLQEYLFIISEQESQVEILRQRVRDLQIVIIELENERNDAVDLAKDLSLQLTRARLAKDTALRTSRQLMEQFPTRPPRDQIPESSTPSTPIQTDPPVLSSPLTPDQYRYLPQPPGKYSGNNKISAIESSTPLNSYETGNLPGNLPRSVQFFKKSLKDQKQSETLPSKIHIRNNSSSKPTVKSNNTERIPNHSNRESPGLDRLSPLQETSPTNTNAFRLRSDSSPDLAMFNTPIEKPLEINTTIEKTLEINTTENPNSDFKPVSIHKHKESSTTDESMGRRTISMSLLASGLGLKSKNKDKDKGVKFKKVKTVEDPIKTNSNSKIHKRFSSLNSLPNAFKRSSKLEDKDKRKQEYIVPHPSDKQQKGSRLSEGTLEIEFKHISGNSALSSDKYETEEISIYRPSDKFRIASGSLPTSDQTEETSQILKNKNLKERNNIPNDSQVIINRSTLQLEK